MLATCLFFQQKLAFNLKFLQGAIFLCTLQYMFRNIPSLIQFDKINASCEQFFMGMRKQDTSIIIQTKLFFVLWLEQRSILDEISSALARTKLKQNKI